MPEVGPLEILVLGLLALIVFGPDKLPEIARQIGKAVNELRRMTQEVREDLDTALKDLEADEGAEEEVSGEEAGQDGDGASGVEQDGARQ